MARVRVQRGVDPRADAHLEHAVARHDAHPLEREQTTRVQDRSKEHVVNRRELAVDAFNEIVLETSKSSGALIARAREKDLHVGIDVSERIPGNRQLLKISFSDKSGAEACNQLVSFFEEQFPAGSSMEIPELEKDDLREGTVGLPDLPDTEIRSYYDRLGSLNVSPDSGCYPLGSCTMKYNPFVNDWAASLPGFTDAHPQAPIEDVQGCLEVLFEI